MAFVEGEERPTSPADIDSDADFMGRLAAGDCEPLGLLYRRYGKMVFSVIRDYMPMFASQDAEDVCQEVFLSLKDTAARYHHTGQLRSWICGIAVRKAKEHRRNRWLRRALLGQFGAAAPGPAIEQSPAEGRLDLDRALQSLSEPHREVLHLHSIENLSTDEIAQALGISVKTVWTRLHRARKAMREALDQP